MAEMREQQIIRVYEAMNKVEPGTEQYDKLQDQALKFERQDNEEQKVVNAWNIDASRQVAQEENAKKQNLQFWVGTGLSVLTIGVTLFASETRIACREIPNMLKQLPSKIFR